MKAKKLVVSINGCIRVWDWLLMVVGSLWMLDGVVLKVIIRVGELPFSLGWYR